MSATADGAIWRGEGAKTNPTADAPMPTASRASASVVTPQILTNIARRRPARRRRDSRLTGRLRAARPRRPGGQPTGPGSPPPARPGSRRRPARPRRRRRGSPTRPPPPRRPGSTPARRRARWRSTSKVRRSRWLTPITPAPASRARFSSSSSCTSTSAVKRAPAGQAEEGRELGVGEGGHDQQDGVGPHGPGVAHVEGADREVLAQDREASRPPGPARGRSALPPKNSPSVSTDRQAAPPASYSAATAAGSRAGSRSPLDGDRRLISAITAIPSAGRRRRRWHRRTDGPGRPGRPASSAASRSRRSSAGRRPDGRR